MENFWKPEPVTFYPLQIWMAQHWEVIYVFGWSLYFTTFLAVIYIFLIRPHWEYFFGHISKKKHESEQKKS